MKFIKYLESITGVGIYPLISLMIFFIFFTALIIYVFRADKQQLIELKNIPLDENGSKKTN
jgi:cytochrome c oxidase cbb3-type subunit 3